MASRGPSGARTPRCLLAAPFFSPCDGQLAGVCVVYNKMGPRTKQGSPYNFSQDDQALMHHSLLLGSLAIENAALRGHRLVVSAQSMERAGEAGRRTSQAPMGGAKTGGEWGSGLGGQRGNRRDRRGSVSLDGAEGESGGGGRNARKDDTPRRHSVL